MTDLHRLAKTEVKERPIVFSAEMVRAILEGRKTMTRRVVKPQPIGTAPARVNNGFSFGRCRADDEWVKCPYGVPGDRLWVKETFADDCPLGAHGDVIYAANAPEGYELWKSVGGKWKSPLFMPRWASRILLEIVSVRVERVQEISEDDAEAEGVETWYWSQVDHDPEHPAWWKTPMVRVARERHRGSIAPDAQFAGLWDTIYAKKPESQWDANPYVWVIEFKVVTP